MNCVFCNSIFLNKTTLKNHQANAKYCLKLQGEEINNKFNCKECGKQLSTKNRLLTHLQVCEKVKNNEYEKKINILKSFYEEKILLIEKEKENYESQITQQKLHIKELENKLENIAIKAVCKPTSITNNNNSRINQIINNLTPITSQHIADNAQFLTLDHIKNGASGYAKYALEYPLKDKVLCVDYARRKIKYKDEEGNLVDDPEMTKLCQKFFIAIESHNNNLLNTYNTSILDRMLSMNNDDNNEMTEEEGQKCMEIGNILLEEMMKVKNLKTDIEDIKKGNKPVMYHDFVKDVCSKTVC
jgi:hypothetical protein